MSQETNDKSDDLVRAFAKLAGLRQNLNPERFNPDQDFIAIYEHAIDQLENASGRDLSEFRTKDTETFYPHRGASPGTVKHISASLMAAKLDAILLYARTMVPEGPVRRMGFDAD